MKQVAAASTPAGSQRLQNAYHALGVAVMLTLALYFGQVVLIPLALAALFAFILSVPAEWVEKRGLGRTAGVLLVTLAAFAILAGVVTVATVEIRSLAADLPQYEGNIERKMDPVKGLLKRFEKIKSNLSEAAPDGVKQPSTTQATPVVVKSQGDSTLTWLPSLARPVVDLLVNGVLVIVLTVFMLIQRETFRDRLIRLAGRSRLSSTTRALEDAAARVGKYLLLQLAINSVLGTVVAIGLYFMGVPHAPLWGLLVTVLRFVPYVGYWMAGLGAIAMSAAVSPGWGHPLLVFGLFAVLDLVMANVIEPLVFSHGTGVSPVALLVAAVFWAFLWGPVGLLLSTPLTVCMAVLGKHVPALGFLAILLGDEPSLDPAAQYYNRLLARDYDEAAVLLDAYSADHPADEAYDRIILPALAQVKTDREQGDVTHQEELAVYDGTRALLDGLSAANDPHPSTAAKEGVRPVRIVGCAVFGQADALALRMLGDAVAPVGGDLVVAQPDDLADVIAKTQDSEGRSPVVCFLTLSPGGLSQARSLIASTRRRYPSAKLMVGRWGQAGDTRRTEKYLRESGADEIGWTLRETIAQLVPDRNVAQTDATPHESRSAEASA